MFTSSFTVYLATVIMSPVDWFIWIGAFTLVVFHLWYILNFKAYNQYQLEIRRDRLLYWCEFFPLAGLAGTMFGLLGTFASMGEGSADIATVIQKFSPALSTTLSGLLALMINLSCNFILSWKISASGN